MECIPGTRIAGKSGAYGNQVIRRVLALLIVLLSTCVSHTPSLVLARSHVRHAVSTPDRRSTARCRGSTRAHVQINWPSVADQATNQRLHWGFHMSRKIKRWAYLVVPIATSAGVDPYLVAGIMRVESGGDPLAWNLDSDAHGLMQVLHASFEPAINIRAAISMLADLQREFGSRDLVLAGYNAGPGAVQQYGGIPPYTETRDYVIMVDYFRDHYAGVHLPAARVTRFKAAVADIEAYYRRICGKQHLL